MFVLELPLPCVPTQRSFIVLLAHPASAYTLSSGLSSRVPPLLPLGLPTPRFSRPHLLSRARWLSRRQLGPSRPHCHFTSGFSHCYHSHDVLRGFITSKVRGIITLNHTMRHQHWCLGVKFTEKRRYRVARSAALRSAILVYPHVLTTDHSLFARVPVSSDTESRGSLFGVWALGQQERVKTLGNVGTARPDKWH
jgi:hypothetical protein